MNRYVDDKGYVRIFLPNHPHNNNGYVLEHRTIVEKAIGRYLETNEVVHHINEIKTDNRLENLYLCTPEEHVRIHNRHKQFSPERKNNIRQGVREANKRKRKKK